MTGVELIAAERERQISVEGWSAEHDDTHDAGELAAAAECYAALASDQMAGIIRRRGRIGEVPLQWPFAPRWWKPSEDPARNLAKAGALTAAEIDRLTRRTHAGKNRDPENT